MCGGGSRRCGPADTVARGVAKAKRRRGFYATTKPSRRGACLSGNGTIAGSSKPPLTDKTNVPSNSISITYLTESETIDSGSENCTEGYVTDLRFNLISDDHVAFETHGLPTKCVFVLIGFLEVQDIVLDMTPHNRYAPKNLI